MDILIASQSAAPSTTNVEHAAALGVLLDGTTLTRLECEVLAGRIADAVRTARQGSAVHS